MLWPSLWRSSRRIPALRLSGVYCFAVLEVPLPLPFEKPKNQGESL